MFKLTSPWVEYYYKLKTLFEDDPNIMVFYDEDNNVVKLYVESPPKYEALEQLLPKEQVFGNAKLTVEVVPANGHDTSEAALYWKSYSMCAKPIELFERIFNGNPALSYTKTISGIFTNEVSYVVFRNKVVQYYNDSLADIHGKRSTLYQEIAKEVFGNIDGVFFCTAEPDEFIPF